MQAAGADRFEANPVKHERDWFLWKRVGHWGVGGGGWGGGRPIKRRPWSGMGREYADRDVLP